MCVCVCVCVCVCEMHYLQIVLMSKFFFFKQNSKCYILKLILNMHELKYV